MADQKISDLGDGGAPQDPDDFVVARGGTNVKLAWSSLSAVAASNQIAVTVDGNTAGVLAPITSGTVTLAGGNNITLSQVGNAVTISGPNAGGAQTGISSIGNSEATYTSGAIELVNTGAIAIASNAGQQFVFSVDPQSVQPETQTFIGGISASDTAYTSGTVRITGVGGGVTVSSNTGQRIDISVAAQSVQPETQTFVAGISASDTLYTSGNVRLTGVGGGVTISSNTGQRVDISVAAQSVQPETQTFIAGVSASDTLYTSGNVRITGVGGGITVSSNTGQRIDLSVAAQSVQPETQTFIGGVSASNTLYTSGSVRFTGSGAVTVRSGTGQLVVIDSPTQTTQVETQTFVGGIANSQTTYTSGTVGISELGAVTFRSTTGNQYQISVNSQTVQTQGGFVSLGVSTGGNTTGNTQVSTGSRFVLVGSGNLTLSQATAAGASTVTLSVAAQTTQVETQTFVGGVVGSNATYTSGTVTITGVGGGITVSSNTGQRIDLSVAAQSAQTQGILAVGASTGGNTSGDTGVASGTRLVLVGSNGITVSQGTAANATTLTLSGITQTVQTQGGFVSLGVSTGGNSSGNTQVSTGSRFVLVASGNLTASQATAAGASTVTLSVAAQTVQTQNMVAVSATNTLYSSGTVLFTGSNMITVKSSGAGQTIILDATQTVQTQSNIAALYDGANSISTGTVRVTNANGVSFSVNAQTLSASVNESISMFAVSNTTQNTSGTAHKSALSFGGAGIASVGVTGGSVVISVPSGGGAGDGGVFAGASTMGNTAGSTGTVSTGNFVLVGTGPISLSQSTGAAGSAATISINAPATSSLSGTGGIQLSTNGSTISIGYTPVLNDWENIPSPSATLMTHVSAISKTPFYWHDQIPGQLSAKSLAVKISMVTASQPLSVSVHLGVYTFVNSTSAALLGSHSEAFHVSSASSVSLSGARNLIMTGIGTHATLSTISQGEYMLGLMFSATATNAMNFSLMGANSVVGVFGGIYPGTNNLSTGTSQGVMALYGRGSTTVNAMPANVVASELVNYGQGASMQLHPWIYIRS